MPTVPVVGGRCVAICKSKRVFAVFPFVFGDLEGEVRARL